MATKLELEKQVEELTEKLEQQASLKEEKKEMGISDLFEELKNQLEAKQKHLKAIKKPYRRFSMALKDVERCYKYLKAQL